MTAETVTVYADYACPFCYLGRASLDSYRERRTEPLAVEWHPFDLLADRRDESGEIVDEMDDEYVQQAWENVQRLAAEYDVPVPDDPVTDTDSRRAQLLSLFVQRERPDDWAALDDALYDAVWVAERDVGDPAVLSDVATSVGLEADLVDRVLSDEDLAAELDERFAAARQRGISGVPTFVAGDRAARGAVPPAQLRQLVEGTG